MHLPIDVVLTEAELARGFVAALEQREIPERYFYWFPLSVRAWLALCTAGPYRNFSRSQELVAQHAGAIAARTRPGTVEVISLGAGQGDKDRFVLAALVAAGREVAYRPVDASIGLLELAVRDALAAGYATIGIKADFTEPSQVASLLRPGRRPRATRLFLMLGNTLGAFDPARLAAQLRALMGPSDLAVVDGELYAGPETLAGYDNPVNRRFAFAPLEAAGLVPDDGELAFEIEPDERRAGVVRVIKHFTALRPATLNVAGERLRLEQGERLAMSPSHKYHEPGFHALLDEAGLVPLVTFRSADERFVMSVVRSRDGSAAGA